MHPYATDDKLAPIKSFEPAFSNSDIQRTKVVADNANFFPEQKEIFSKHLYLKSLH